MEEQQQQQSWSSSSSSSSTSSSWGISGVDIDTSTCQTNNTREQIQQQQQLQHHPLHENIIVDIIDNPPQAQHHVQHDYQTQILTPDEAKSILKPQNNTSSDATSHRKLKSLDRVQDDNRVLKQHQQLLVHPKDASSIPTLETVSGKDDIDECDMLEGHDRDIVDDNTNNTNNKTKAINNEYVRSSSCSSSNTTGTTGVLPTLEKQQQQQHSVPTQVSNSVHVQQQHEQLQQDENKQVEVHVPIQQQQQQQQVQQQPSIEKERQLLILVLLAQVCALHDPTPRTFTIHVLELYERAILDTESINFLFEFGLVPPMKPNSTTSTTSTNNNKTSVHAASNSKLQSHKSNPQYPKKQQHPVTDEFEIHHSESTDGKSVLQAAIEKGTNKHIDTNEESFVVNNADTEGIENNSKDCMHNNAVVIEYTRTELLRQRSLEASAIRSMLSLLDQDNNDNTNKLATNDNNNNFKQITSAVNVDETNTNENKAKTNRPQDSSTTNNPATNIPTSAAAAAAASTLSSWSVQEYQLSLSRYQREFKQICLLSSGAFGLVYKAINIMDQREYAIKQIQFNATGYNRTSLERTMREVQCLAICDHPNVVRYYTSWFEPSWMTGATTTTATTSASASTYNIEEEDNEDDYDNDADYYNDDTTTNEMNDMHQNRHRRPRAQSSDLTQDLKAYFKDPNFSSSHSKMKKNDKNKKLSKKEFTKNDYSSWTNESSNQLQQQDDDEDDDISTWTITQQKQQQQWIQPELSLTSSRDDIFFEESMTSERRMIFSNEISTGISSRDDSTIFDRSQQEQEKSETIDDNNYEQRQLVIRPNSNPNYQQYNPRQKHVRRNNNNTGKKHSNTNNQKYQIGTRYKYQICLYIQMQLCHPATLADWIRERNQNHRSSANSSLLSSSSIDDRIHSANQIFKQIVCGLNHVHQKGIIHRDLKPSNIFFCATATTTNAETNNNNNTFTELQFKIGDFGLSKVLSSSRNDTATKSSPRNGSEIYLQKQQQHKQQQRLLLTQGSNSNSGNNKKWTEPLTAGVGTASYAAPEQVDTTTYSSAADIYSIGLILLELLCSFSTEHERLQTFYDCRTRRIVPTDIVDKYPIASKTILACTELIASKRPTANDLEQIEFVLVSCPIHPTCGLSKTASGGSSSVATDTITNTGPPLLLTYEPTTVEDIENRNGIVTHERCTVDVDIATLRRQLDELQSKVDEYETQIDEKDAIIFDLRLEMDNMKSR